MRLAHFYHIWTGGRWQEPLYEHLAALVESGYFSTDHAFFPVTVNNGWEQETISRLYDYSKRNDGAVLYAHTKGAADPSEFNARWRRSMTDRVVRDWEHNLALLDHYQAVGCHWLTPERFPQHAQEFREGIPFFGGNFWMARCDYLRTLPECPTEDRWQAERWIGMGGPRVLDLNPGWPAEELF